MPEAATADPVDLNVLWEAIEAGLQARSLRRFDAIPEQEAVFAPDGMTWEAFVDLAAGLDVGLVYAAAPTFALDLDALEDEGLDDDMRAELRVLWRDARRYAGQIGEIELCFAHQGLLHLWSIQQPWLQPLVDRAAVLRGRRSGTGALWDAADQADRDDARRQRDELAARWTAELLAVPELRVASSYGERQDLAMARHTKIRDALTTPGHPDQWAAHDALRAMGDQIRADRARVVAELTDRVVEFAPGLAETAGWREATTKTTAMQVAKEYLATQGDGYAPPRYLVEKLYNATAKLAPIRRARQQGLL